MVFFPQHPPLCPSFFRHADGKSLGILKYFMRMLLFYFCTKLYQEIAHRILNDCACVCVLVSVLLNLIFSALGIQEL